MKRFLAILLCLATLLVGFVACANGEEEEDKGATIDIYMDETFGFDPALCYNDVGSAEFLSLTYEGLFYMNEKGKIKKGLCKKYKITENEDGSETLVISLGESYWSDGIRVDAADFVYAWNRIMDPEFKCEAAALLFPVKNAVEVKNGDVRRDDIGFYSSGTYEITIDLNVGVDAETFLSNLTSVALYPLRKEVVRSVKDENWASLSAVLVSNGPFYVKSFEMITDSQNDPQSITLERNQYYRREPDTDVSIKKYVTPYRICVHYVTAEEAYEKYKSGEYAFTSDIPLAERKKLLEEVTMLDNMFTYSYMFNMNSETVADPKARQALSLAIDRKAIQDIVVYAEAADSLISELVYETTKGTSFHKGVISTSAKLEEAKKLASEAGLKGKSITLVIANEAVDIAVAEYCVGVWKQLGVNASYEILSYYGYDYKEEVIKTNSSGDKVIEMETIYEDVCGDKLRDAYNTGTFEKLNKDGKPEVYEFDIIAVNYNMLSTDAFAVLAPFAPKYSGGAYDFSASETEWPLIPHTSGYNSEAYAALIDAAYNAKTPEERAKKLHEAEKLLVADDCVVVPLYFGRTAYLVNDNIKKLDNNFAGHVVWTKAKDKNYVPTVEEAPAPSTGKENETPAA
ncbi:MAG: hypothetical protein J6M35_00210 [Clostridia bacterium]|nr:hypothetical protein [Clostridia bacterium]